MAASLTASEVEFLAEQELITILPHFHIKENGGMMNFINGDFGPFQPGITTQVPLWLAIMLKQLNKCRIIPPSWFSVEFLTTRLEREKNSDVFEELPFHYLEISSLLFKHAVEDIEQVEHIRSLLEDIQNVRQDKIRNGLYKISSDVQSGGTAYAIQMNNISALEINSVRQFMIGSLNKFYRLATLSEDAGEDFSTQTQSQMYSEPSSGTSTSTAAFISHSASATQRYCKKKQAKALHFRVYDDFDELFQMVARILGNT